jgi:hypothetical protein
MSKPHLIEVRNVKVIFIVQFLNPGVSVSLWLHDTEHGFERTLHHLKGMVRVTCGSYM